MTSVAQLPTALTIAGSDSGGQAGIQADLKAFFANQVHGCSVTCCLTAQNAESVSAIRSMDTEFVIEQMRQVISYYQPAAIKTGMLFKAEIVEAVTQSYKQLAPETPLIVDPVMVASSGELLLEQAAVDAIKQELLPTATLITPNLDEAEVLCDMLVTDVDSMVACAYALQQTYGCGILLKGGHLNTDTLTDILLVKEAEPVFLQATRNPTINTHGSGCTLSAAIAAQVAAGCDIANAVANAHAYLQRGMRNGLLLNGKQFINHGA